MTARTLPATTEAIEAAIFNGKGVETEYRIESCPGLVLTVKRPKLKDGSSSKRWRFHYSVQNNKKQIKDRVNIGIYPQISLSDATRKAAELQERLDAGWAISPTEEKAARLRKSVIPFASIGDDPIRVLIEELRFEVGQLRDEVADLRRQVAKRSKG